MGTLFSCFSAIDAFEAGFLRATANMFAGGATDYNTPINKRLHVYFNVNGGFLTMDDLGGGG